MVLREHHGSCMKWKGWERIPLRISDNAGNTGDKGGDGNRPAHHLGQPVD